MHNASSFNTCIAWVLGSLIVSMGSLTNHLGFMLGRGQSALLDSSQ